MGGGYYYIWHFLPKLNQKSIGDLDQALKPALKHAEKHIVGGLIHGIEVMFAPSTEEPTKKELKEMEKAAKEQSESFKQIILGAIATKEFEKIMQDIILDAANKIMENMAEDMGEAQEGQEGNPLAGMDGMNFDALEKISANPLGAILMMFQSQIKERLNTGGTNTSMVRGSSGSVF